ncbi:MULTISPECIES: RnfH family protein [unclassified Acinetobacter]|uniref:RnfH family protein n=1 Tax=unclassified Acinetobacter TaxID=196816 RepID=UPI0029345F93|nr:MULTISPECIES: RnfH family protein [unclassified Acinetobacter]WOE32983.1 RnfH family protein [Acinetobacter sp. SAAs470]WOE38461.1 RnfH family protein [Acinetobacter sp. SAAs474]
MSVEQVWVVYASPQQQLKIAVDFYEGMTAIEAINLSGIRQQVQLSEPFKWGIFATVMKDLQHQLTAGDRIEIYRPLTIHPQDIRRKRAQNYPVGRVIKGNRFKQLK